MVAICIVSPNRNRAAVVHAMNEARDIDICRIGDEDETQGVNVDIFNSFIIQTPPKLEYHPAFILLSSRSTCHALQGAFDASSAQTATRRLKGNLLRTSGLLPCSVLPVSPLRDEGL